MSGKITDIVQVGENDHGYRFEVGKVSGRWVGYAVGDVGGGKRGVFFLPGIDEDHLLGVTDRDHAIRMTSAIAQAPEHGYGGIARWFIPESLRASPDDFRCRECEEIGCRGECSDDYDPPF